MIGMAFRRGRHFRFGVYLGVHEGPQRISKTPNTVSLLPGMIVSNEPGYYKEGGYGIRIENLQYVTPAEPIPGGERPMTEPVLEIEGDASDVLLVAFTAETSAISGASGTLVCVEENLVSFEVPLSATACHLSAIPPWSGQPRRS